MDLTVAEVVVALKSLIARQDEITSLENGLVVDVRVLDQQVRSLLNSGTISDEDRNQLIEGLSSFVADTYKRVVARNLRTQVDLDTEDKSHAQPDPTVGGFPHLA